MEGVVLLLLSMEVESESDLKGNDAADLLNLIPPEGRTIGGTQSLSEEFYAIESLAS